MAEERFGPLQGVRVVELASIGPGPHAATILADLGAEVVRVERPGGAGGSAGPRDTDFLLRGRPSVALDLKRPDAVEAVLQLVEAADLLIEGMRPGVAERLGLGPEQAMARNPALVYGRMTGWGQDGPMARRAGHDLNYLALSGVLAGLGQDSERPHFPSNLVGDFGGGSTYLVIGCLAALLESRLNGKGQVVDAAILDGTAHLNLMGASLLAGGVNSGHRGENLLDGGAPCYQLYETSDGGHMSVGALEPQFYAELVDKLDLPVGAPGQWDIDRVGELQVLIADRFRSRTRAEWTEVFAGSDACCVPVLSVNEAAKHPHVAARGVYVEAPGGLQPAPAPRFSGTPARLSSGPSVAGDGTIAVLTAWGVRDVEALIASGAAVQA